MYHNTMSVEQQDEIKSFIDARYVSAPEACWRIFSFSMHKEHPSHQRLAIHLEGENPVYFNEEENINDVLRRAITQETTLTAWFRINRTDENARSILYPNFPEQYVWHNEKRVKRWEIRKRGFGGTIGRIYAVSPKKTETYHLRMLLYHVPGATSFAFLRTVNGVQYESFQDAARALGLLSSDDQWKKCLEEAADTQSPRALRKLFCIILVFCEPSDPFQLWLNFQSDLSEDYLYQLMNDSSVDSNLVDIEEISFNNALLDINDSLCEQHGTSITMYTRFVLPAIDTRENVEDSSISTVIREQKRLNAIARNRQDSFDINSLNTDQSHVYESIIQCVERNGCESTITARIFFVDGPGGTGKTYLFNTIINTIRSGEDGFALAVASSGTAALLMDGGRTAHSTFRIPLEVSSSTMCGIKPRSEQAELLKKPSL